MRHLVLVCVLACLLPLGARAGVVEDAVAAAITAAAGERALVVQDNLAQQMPLPVRDIPKGFASWSLHEYGNGGLALQRCEALETLVAQVQKAEDPDTVPAHVRAALPFLQDKSPQRRTAACEFLAHFPHALLEVQGVETVAALLDDTAVAFRGVDRLSPPFGLQLSKETPLTLTVRDVARLALFEVTMCRFPDRAAFTRWWGEHRYYHRRLWYWGRYFHGTPAQMAIFEKMPEAEALRLLLLMSNYTARKVERDRPWYLHEEKTPEGLDGGVYHSADRRPNQVGAFVKRHRLQETVLDLLAGKTAYPDIKDSPYEDGKRQLGWTIVELLPVCLARGDVPRLEEILNSGKALPAVDTRLQTRLTEVAIALDWQRREEILLAQLRRNPRQPELGRQLLDQSGLKHWELLQRLYLTTWPPDGQALIIRELTHYAKPEFHQRLTELYLGDKLDVDLDAKGEPAKDDGARCTRLRAFADAAQHLNGGTPVVKEDTLRAATSYGGKISTEQLRAQLAAMPPARTETIALLTAFYQGVKGRMKAEG
ncbi:MAG: hypothetical protein ACYC7E_22230 [Armatimonadota bacterium]